MPRKRLLVLAPRVPLPPIGGDKLRLMQIAHALAPDYDLTLLAMSDDLAISAAPNIDPFISTEVVHLSRWRSRLNTLLALGTRRPLQLAYYDSSAFRARVRALAPAHDGVIAHLIRSGQYVAGMKRPPVLLEMTDAISLNYQRAQHTRGARDWRNIVYAVEQKRLHEYEKKIALQFAATWLVSQIDADFLFGKDASRSMASISCIPAGVDLREFPFQGPRAGKTIVFIGNMFSAQNRDACRWFQQNVLPTLVAAAPEIRFRMIGPMQAADSRYFAGQPSVETTGSVERIANHTADAFCGVCPVRIGAGMQNKILNYMALGLPCATTDIGLEGIDATPERDLLVFHTAEQAAQQILRLYKDAALRQTLAINGRALVERAYDREIIFKQMRLHAHQLFG